MTSSGALVSPGNQRSLKIIDRLAENRKVRPLRRQYDRNHIIHNHESEILPIFEIDLK